MRDKKFYDLIAAGDLDPELVLIKPKILPNVPEDVVGPDDWEVRGVVEDAYRSKLIDGNLEPVLNEPTGNEEEDYNHHDLEKLDQVLDGLSYAAQARWFRLVIDGKIPLPKDYKGYKMLWQVIPQEFVYPNILPEVKSLIASQRTDFENDAILYLEDDFLRNADNIKVSENDLTNDGFLKVFWDVEPNERGIKEQAIFHVQKGLVKVTLERWIPTPEHPVLTGRAIWDHRTLRSLDELIILCDSIKDGSIVITES